MGLATSSNYFQRFTDMVVGDLRYMRGPANERSDHEPGDGASDREWWKDGSRSKVAGSASVFVDDIACRSSTKQGHLQDIRALFDRLAKYRCALGIGKCKFFQKNILFLGHIVSREGIESDPKSKSNRRFHARENAETERCASLFADSGLHEEIH